MIVVRTNDHIFVRLSGQIRQNVIHCGARGLDVDLQRDMQRIGQRERLRLAEMVDLDLPAACSHRSATSFFTCTSMMPVFSGPLTLPKRVSRSSSPSPSLPFTSTRAFAPWFRALMALVINWACRVRP